MALSESFALIVAIAVCPFITSPFTSSIYCSLLGSKLATCTLVIRVATEAAERDRISKAKAEQAKRDSAQDAVAKRKAAAPTTTRADKKTVIDYLDENDEDYEAWYKRVQDMF